MYGVSQIVPPVQPSPPHWSHSATNVDVGAADELVEVVDVVDDVVVVELVGTALEVVEVLVGAALEVVELQYPSPAPQYP